jgi:hypothetical protein
VPLADLARAIAAARKGGDIAAFLEVEGRSALRVEPRHCGPYRRYDAPWRASLCAKRSRAMAAYAAAVRAGGSNGPPPRSRPR